MYIVRNDGYVGVRGHLYSMGQYWGEDFILATPHLRNNIRAVAISYVEVVTTSRDTVFELLEEYPSEKADVRIGLTLHTTLHTTHYTLHTAHCTLHSDNSKYHDQHTHSFI